MDWDLAIARKRRALGVLLATMMVMIASGEGRCAVLRLLRPAESALRRVIYIMAKRSAHKVGATAKTAARALPDFSRFGASDPDRVPAFRLIEPRKRFESGGRKRQGGSPRISVLSWETPLVPSFRHLLPVDRQAIASQLPRGGSSDGARLDSGDKPRNDGQWGAGDDRRADDDGDLVNDAALTRRIKAFAHALDTLPQQARRMARLMERRRHAPPGPASVGPLRPGLPPGVTVAQARRLRQTLYDPDEAVAMAYECHAMARDIEAVPP